MVAALMGTMIPLAFKRCNFDPAIGSGIFVTATTDIIGFFIFLSLAQVFITRL
jgi:magnesium transporter